MGRKPQFYLPALRNQVVALRRQFHSLGRRNQLRLLIGAGVGLGILSIGAAWITLSRPGFDRATDRETLESDLDSALDGADEAPVPSLAMQPPAERRQALEAIATGSVNDIDKGDRLQARYLLATDLLAQGEAEQALVHLARLERDYPDLAPYVLIQRAEAQTQLGQARDAEGTWQTLLKRHGDHPAAAEALYALGSAENADPKYWQRAVDEFAAHPTTVTWMQRQLAENPNQPDLLLRLARHALYLPEAESILDRLTQDYSDRLQPDNWEAIGFGYWEMQRYGSAGSAYANAPKTALNLYRAGRGAHLDNRRNDAIARYQTLSRAFPEAEETAQALLHLGKLAQLEPSIAYADKVIETFPERAAEALLLRSELLTLLDSPESARQARQSILSQYGDSETAAELRWTQAQQATEVGDIATAWQWAAEVVRQTPESEYAPAAAFWIGRWANQTGNSDAARAAFEYILTTYPESYYAWRSAIGLGWDVGDFSTARYKKPDITLEPVRLPLPVGSDTLQTLYRLGQDEDAWALWQVEYDNPIQPTVAQQMTDGLLRLGVGDNLEGIFMLSSLDWRAQDTDEFGLDDARRSSAYWQGLYPFPFRPLIENWSAVHRLNPFLVTALIRQESRFEQDITSVADARGLMQIIPPTAEWVAGQLGLSSYQLTDPEDNIQMGTWYLNYTHQEYSDNSLYAVASYNAGPGNVADWITRFDTSDPDQFIAQIPFPETKDYVRSVFENYWNYLRLYNPEVIEGLSTLSTQTSADAKDLSWLERPVSDASAAAESESSAKTDSSADVDSARAE